MNSQIMEYGKEEDMTYRTEGLAMVLWSGCALCITLAIILLLPVSSWAHGFAGKRFFPTTFQVDDPYPMLLEI